MKRRSRWSVVLVLCTAFMLSSTTVYAATGECADAYVRMESETSVEDEYQYPETASPKIHMEYGDTERITCVEGENIEQSTRDSYGFQWDLPVGYRKYAPYVSCTQGMDLFVTVAIDPTYVEIRVGIEDELGYRYYVEGTDAIYVPFEIPNNRRYRVYTQNDSLTDVSIVGSYLTRD